jgi:hypothetical protein
MSTFCVIGAEVLLFHAEPLVSLLNTAVRECGPTASVVIASVPIPDENELAGPKSVPVPTPPSQNSMLPVTVGEFTVAVKVTLWPTIDGFGELVRMVVVLTPPAMRNAGAANNRASESLVASIKRFVYWGKWGHPHLISDFFFAT